MLAEDASGSYHDYPSVLLPFIVNRETQTFSLFNLQGLWPRGPHNQTDPVSHFSSTWILSTKPAFSAPFFFPIASFLLHFQRDYKSNRTQRGGTDSHSGFLIHSYNLVLVFNLRGLISVLTENLGVELSI